MVEKGKEKIRAPELSILEAYQQRECSCCETLGSMFGAVARTGCATCLRKVWENAPRLLAYCAVAWKRQGDVLVALAQRLGEVEGKLIPQLVLDDERVRKIMMFHAGDVHAKERGEVCGMVAKLEADIARLCEELYRVSRSVAEMEAAEALRKACVVGPVLHATAEIQEGKGLGKTRKKR